MNVTRPAPSQAMGVDVATLIETVSVTNAQMSAGNVPHAYRVIVNSLLQSQLAIAERLQAILILVEHGIMAHMCDEGEEEGNGKKKDVDRLIDDL